MQHKVIQIDTRGAAMDIAMQLSREPYIRDLTTISRFIDSEYFTIAGIVARFWQAQVSNQREISLADIKGQIHQLIGGAFCRSDVSLSAPQLEQLKNSFFQALVSAYYARLPDGQNNWDRCELAQLNMDTYVLRCTKEGSAGLFGPASIQQRPLSIQSAFVS